MQRENRNSVDIVGTRADCPFCQRHCIAANILQETPSFRIVADHAPLIEGHLLIIPKSHYLCYGDVPATLDAELQAIKQDIRDFFQQFYLPPIFWEHGIFRQSVFHAHLHAIPFGTITYSPEEKRHSVLVQSAEDIRTWFANNGHYFYLEDAQHALLFEPEMEVYMHIVQHVLNPAVMAKNEQVQWRTTQQRQELGKPFIAALKEKWASFHDEKMNPCVIDSAMDARQS
jgi:diadenosine tetraphosphate (Ap4A) HIT family hydrolase